MTDQTVPAIGSTSVFQKIFSIRKELAWVIFGQFLAFSGGVILIKVLTNILSTESYGQLALGLSISSMISLFVFGPLGQAVMRFYSICKESSGLPSYLYIIRKINLTASIVLLLIAIPVSVIVALYVETIWGLIVFSAVLFGVAGGVNLSFVSLQNAIRQRKIVALHQGVDVWLRMLIVMVIVFFVSSASYMALLGFFLGMVLIVCSQFFWAMKSDLIRSHWHSDDLNTSELRNISLDFRRYYIPFIYFAVFAVISLHADRWILQGLYDEKTVGIYAAIYLIANTPVLLLTNLINQLMVPIIFEQAGDVINGKNMEKADIMLTKTVLLAVVILVPVVFMTYLWSDSIVLLLTNEEYAGFHHVLWVLVLGLSLFNVAQMCSVKGFSYNNPYIYIWPKGIQAACFALMAYLLAYDYGILGVAIALCVSSFVYLLMVLYVNMKL